jgi:PAS domain S-box-containing protein
VVRFGGIVQNITAPLPTENKQETDKLLQAVFDSSAAGISVLKAIRNADGTIVDFEYRLVNRVTEKINNRSDLLGKRYSEIHSAYAASGIFDDFVHVVETGKSIEKKRHYTGEGFNNWFATIAVKQEDGLVFTFRDITDEIIIQKEIEENDIRFRNLIEEAPVATCLVTGKEMKIELVNEVMLSYWGKNKSIIGLPLEKGVPELKGQPFLKTLDDVFTTGTTHVSKSAPVELEIDGVLSTYYFDFINKAIRNGKGEIYGIMDMAVDVTDEVKAIKNLEVSEARFRNLLHQTPFALTLVKGKEFTIELANQKALELWGKSMKDVINKPALEALPELVEQGFGSILTQVFESGERFSANEMPVTLIRNGISETLYINFIYEPFKDSDGKTEGILGVGIDVSEQVVARKKIEVSETRFRSLVQSAPVAIGLFIGRDLIIESPNQAFIDIVGKGWDVVGMPLSVAMPELAGQPFLKILDDVYTTGVPFHTFGTQVNIVQQGVMTHNFYNITYTPLYDEKGEIYAILDIAIDVTKEVKAREEVERAEAALRDAIELAELGTWDIDLETGILQYSERLRNWFRIGKDEVITIERAYQSIRSEDRPLVKKAILHATASVNNGIYDVEYAVDAGVDGSERILHAQGKAFFNDDGVAYKISGTVQDVTAQRKLQLALEGKVQQRTEELLAVNKEVATTNEELAEANKNLLHSNEELAQYAYVASHDLQEPLRKIRVFSDMLTTVENMPEKSKQVIHKIEKATERMSMLIKDLLEFSRLLKSESLMRPVSLDDIASAVINDFELVIQEKRAIIKVEPLPVIEAVSLQMNQLFYNLIGNALKFTSADRTPEINISAKVLNTEQVHQYIAKPGHFSQYYCISITDNGIGFDTRYSDQIFEVFKRLHGRDLYPGSGIGLALCRRIVANHHGHLYAQSQVGKGTTFHLILPGKQHDFQPLLPGTLTWKN